MFHELLKKFGKLEEYEQKVKKLIDETNYKKSLQEKFNGEHIIKQYGLLGKQIGEAKSLFSGPFSSK